MDFDPHWIWSQTLWICSRKIGFRQQLRAFWSTKVRFLTHRQGREWNICGCSSKFNIQEKPKKKLDTFRFQPSQFWGLPKFEMWSYTILTEIGKENYFLRVIPTTWNSICHIYSDMLSGIRSDISSDILPAYILTFYLAFHLTYILTFSQAFYLA